MEKKSDYKDYLVEIRDSIKSYLDESATREDTVAEYRRLLREYRRYRKSNTADVRKGTVSGILYHHNVSNFSKLTALFSIKGGEITEIGVHGDTTALEGIKGVLLEKADTLQDRALSSTVLEKREDITYTLYVYSFESGDRRIIAAALSSSYYFRDSVFRHLCEFIYRLFITQERGTGPEVFDTVAIMTDDFNEFFEDLQGNSAVAQVYIIRNYNRIFNRMDTHNMIEAAGFIRRSLMDYYPAGVRLNMPAPWIYIITYTDPDVEQHLEKSGVTLRYKDITLPYRKKQIEINSSAPVHVFLNDVYSFESEVIEGDRTG